VARRVAGCRIDAELNPAADPAIEHRVSAADLCCGAHRAPCYQSRIGKTPRKGSDIGKKTGPIGHRGRLAVRLHAPTKGWFTASLIIALVAVMGALSPMPYVTSYGVWVAILAYVVLAVGHLAAS